MVKAGRFGPYVTTVVPRAARTPRDGELFTSMSPETVTLDEALQLLTLPRTLGTAPDGEEIMAQNGRYGPYIKKGTDSRSLEHEEQLFTVTLDEALALFAQPKQRGRARRPRRRCKELGDDPVTEKPMVVKDGRFGPYVTDGETNASAAQGRRRRGDHHRAGGRAARRPPRPRPGDQEEGGQEDHREEDDREEGRGEEGARQEGRREEGRCAGHRRLTTA